MLVRASLRSIAVCSAFLWTAGCMQEAPTNVTSENIAGSDFSPNEVARQKDGYRLYSGRVPATQYSYDIEETTSRVVAFITPKELVDCTGDFSGNCQKRSFARAVVSCKSDQVTDNLQCKIRIDAQEQVHMSYTDPKDTLRYRVAGSLLFIKNRSGSTISACVMSHDFPGKTAAIRFDKNEHVNTATNACVNSGTARNLEQQARDASLLTTRRVEWPYETSKDVVTRVDGLYSVAEKLLNHMINNEIGPL